MGEAGMRLMAEHRHLERGDADLLVIGKGQMHRPHQPRGGEIRRGRQGQRQKPLHVAGPSAIEAILAAL